MIRGARVDHQQIWHEYFHFASGILYQDIQRSYRVPPSFVLHRLCLRFLEQGLQSASSAHQRVQLTLDAFQSTDLLPLRDPTPSLQEMSNSHVRLKLASTMVICRWNKRVSIANHIPPPVKRIPTIGPVADRQANDINNARRLDFR
jgi:hypothetical protein